MRLEGKKGTTFPENRLPVDTSTDTEASASLVYGLQRACSESILLPDVVFEVSGSKPSLVRLTFDTSVHRKRGFRLWFRPRAVVATSLE
jgi:hypothetical protein